MEQLTIGDILYYLTDLGLSMEEIEKMPIYIGDDEELNGIHTAWFSNIVDIESEDEESVYYAEMINDSHCNVKLKGKGILIS